MAAANAGDDLVPFDLSKAGAVASIDVHVSWLTAKYPRTIGLMISMPKGWKDENGYDLHPQINQLFESITGLIASPNPGNIQPKPHKGIRLHVSWTDQKSGTLMEERIIYRDKKGRVQCGFGIGLMVDAKQLPPGHYVVSVKTIDNDPRFDGTFKTGLCIN